MEPRRILDFEKENDGKWYVILPEWKGEHWESQMVCGADKMLDIISNNGHQASLSISQTPFDGYQIELKFDRKQEGGAWYKLKSDLWNSEVWLCRVVKFIYGNLPRRLYVRSEQ